MNFIVKALEIFQEQIKTLDEKSKRIIKNKIELIKTNPYRYKRIHSKLFSKVFRVRLTINHKETRLVYVVIEPNIILVCLLERGRDYKDLENYLRKIKLE